MKKLIVLLAVLIMSATSALATPFGDAMGRVNNSLLTIDNGVELLMIDGQADINVTVTLGNFDTADGYYLEYSINGTNNWQDVDSFNAYTFDSFNGGDVVDFALRNANSNTRYTLSGDLDDNTYSVMMGFNGMHTANLSSHPIVDFPYYDQVDIIWYLPNSSTFSTSFASDLDNQQYGFDDGFAPVPEPATLLLLGSGLVGLAFLKRRKA